MDFSIAEARDSFTSLVRIAERGESIVITRDGKPVAQLAPPPFTKANVRPGAMKDRITLLPGGDDPFCLDDLVGGDH
jgi:prevent-host-death family protein